MKNFGRPITLILALLMMLIACQTQDEPVETEVPEPTATQLTETDTEETATEPLPTPVIEVVSTQTDASSNSNSEDEVIDAAGEVVPLAVVEFPPPARPFFSPISEAPSEKMMETAWQLETNLPLDRNDTELAKGYLGVTDEQINQSLPAPGIDYQIGDVIEFSVNNFNINTYARVNAELLGISEHGYFWFDETNGNSRPSLAEVALAGAEFDQIYKDVSGFFGTEVQPGIDGHLRVHVLNASPLTLCASSAEQTNVPPCGLLGYFSSLDSQPKAVNKNSNQKEMFVMNGSVFGRETYLSVLAHEYRHMIEANYDNNEIDWEVEGSAVLAEDLVRKTGDAVNRGNSFLLNPDQQLNRWTDAGAGTHYGQGFMLNRFIYDRLGTDLYRQFAQSDLQGLDAVTAVALEADLPFDGTRIWLDWLVAPAIQDFPVVPAEYPAPANSVTVLGDFVSNSGFVADTTVNQFAADYYNFATGQAFTVDFKGDSLVPLIDIQPISGERMWVSRRTNNSMARLTRTLDLTQVDTATLQYDVYRDIEQGYDFAYVAVSADGGATWEQLVSDNMDGLIFQDNPGENALTERFYTGRGDAWTPASADLSPWAGQEILLRFEFVTDPILNFDGIAIDNLAVPEIGYLDPAEEDTGWTAEGFVLATGFIPQTWHLQLVYPTSDGVRVEKIDVDVTGATTFEVEATDGANGPILVVAASAPVTLNPASYRLSSR